MAFLKGIEALDAAIAWLQEAKTQFLEQEDSQVDAVEAPEPLASVDKMAWGAKVSPVFRDRVRWIAEQLDCSADDLMACMHWESGGTFRADIKNAAGSGATGLIQFMPSTAKGLGTTTAQMAKMTPEDQLRYVYAYFKPFIGRLNNLGDVYMAILWPKAVGKPDHYVLFDRTKTPTTFRQNAGLDVNKDGLVTRAECLVKVNERLARGLLPENLG